MLRCQLSPAFPESFCIHHSPLVHIARAQQRSIPVSYLQLQLRKTAEITQVVTRKSVPQRILRPAVGRGVPTRRARRRK